MTNSASILLQKQFASFLAPMTALPSFAEPLGSGVYAIDTGFQRPRFDAAYLIVHGGRAAFIDTGTNHAVPRLLETLEAVGVARGDVDHVIPTTCTSTTPAAPAC
jgi:hypothetical protein